MKRAILIAVLVLSVQAVVALLAAASPVSARQWTVTLMRGSTMDISQLVRGFAKSCPNVSIVVGDTVPDYVMEADYSPGVSNMRYRITLFDRTGKALFSADKLSSNAATKQVCRFLNNAK